MNTQNRAELSRDLDSQIDVNVTAESFRSQMEFLGVDVLLLLIWTSSFAAIMATVIALLYNGFRSKRPGSQSSISNSNSDLTLSSFDSRNKQPEEASSFESNEAISSGVTPTTIVQEAPAPFPEDNTVIGKIPVPSDITAISGVSAVAASAAPVLMIAVPKRKSRSRSRLHSTATQETPRKRRSARKSIRGDLN